MNSSEPTSPVFPTSPPVEMKVNGNSHPSSPCDEKENSTAGVETPTGSPNNYWGTPRRHTWANKGTIHTAALDPFRHVELSLIQCKEIEADIRLFRFQLPNATDQIGCLPGQFVEATIVHNGASHSRFYSPISVFSEYGTLDIVMKMGFTGGMVDHFSRLQVGDKVFFRGPVGGFHYAPNTYDHIVLLATGVGVAPMVQIGMWKNLSFVLFHAFPSLFFLGFLGLLYVPL
jgi:hypothetical protein